MADDFTIDSAEFKAFYKAMTKVDPEVKKAIRKRLMDAAKPIVAEVKQVELNIPATHEAGATRKKKGENLGLRAALASATKADFNGTSKGAAVHIRVSTTKFMSASGRPRTIPYYIEGRRKRSWRHPVFGNRDVWVTQSAHPFLAPTVSAHKEKFAKEVTDAVMDALQQVTPLK
jgi:hypothetical protein